MVDILKSYPFHVHNPRYKLPAQQINLPISLPSIKNLSQNDRANGIQAKRWIGRCPCDPPRLVDSSNSPYNLHRKILYQELVRQCPTMTDASAARKTKQQRNITKNTSKITTGIGGMNIVSETTLSGIDVQSSRLFDTLSKYVTIQTEPLRPTNGFVHSSATTLTSWQKYWTSTHTQRRRQEANDSEPVLYLPKCKQSIPAQIHFVILRDSPFPNTELNSNSRTPSTPPSSCSPTKLSPSSTPDEQLLSSIKDDDVNQTTITELVPSILMPSSIDINASKVGSETSTIVPSKLPDKEDEKYLIEQSLFLSSTHVKGVSENVEEVPDTQKTQIPLEVKVYELPLPSQKTKTKKSLSKRKSRPKSPEKRESRPKSSEKREPRPKSSEKKESRTRTRTPSASKRKRKISINRNSSNTTKQSALSAIMTTTPRSRYAQGKWDEPYVGLRFDPPTPACSPSLFMWPQNSDQEESDSLFDKSEVLQHNCTVKVLESCVF